ncbi:MAG: flavodoxin family protein [Promethearchaeota archaeon]
MVKIWIIYHTKHGNCKSVCENLKSILSEKFDVSIGDVAKIKPDLIVEDSPHLIIVGSRIIIGSPDKKVKKFVNKLGSILPNPISKAATLYTHTLKWESNYAKMAKVLEENNVVKEYLPDILNIKMIKTKGPAEPDQDKNINEFAEKVSEFITR